MGAPTLEHGTVIGGKYGLLREIGRGSAGAVYEAENLLVGKRVAVKLLHAAVAKDEDLRVRFFAEARAAARVAHPHVVDIYDLGLQPDGSPYIVMELLGGETLESILETRGRLSPGYACELVLQVLVALAAAHAHGIVHRDLKPANVIITHPQPDRPHAKVLDFGIAKGIYEAGAAPSEDGMLLGTPLYMAPEQTYGPDVDERADVYSAAVILYELLSSRPPYLASSPPSVLADVVLGGAPRVSTLEPDVPEALAAVIERAMATDPAERTPSAAELARELARFVPQDRRVHSLIPGDGRSAAPLPLVNPSALPAGRIVIRDSTAVLGTVEAPAVASTAHEQRDDAVEAAIHSSPTADARGPVRRDGDPSDSLLRAPTIPRAPITPVFREFGYWIDTVGVSERSEASAGASSTTAEPARIPPVSASAALFATSLGFATGIALAWMTGLL